jgi:hypothetical protein
MIVTPHNAGPLAGPISRGAVRTVAECRHNPLPPIY